MTTLVRGSLALAALLCAGLATAQQQQPQQQQQPNDRMVSVHELVVRGGTSQVLAWSPDGKWIASGGERGDVLVVDAATGRVAHELLASDHCGSLHFTPDSASLFVGGRDLSRWDLRTGACTYRCTLAQPGGLTCSRDGARLVIPLHGSIEVCATADLATVSRMAMPDGAVAGANALSPDGTRLAVVARDGGVLSFALDNGQLRERIEPASAGGEVRAVAWTAAGTLVRLCADGTLHGFTAEPLQVGAESHGMRFSPDTSTCLVVNDKQVRGITRAGVAFTVAGGGPVAWAPSGDEWVRAGRGRIEFHRGAVLQRTVPLAHREQPHDVAFVGDGKHVAVAGDGDRVTVFGVADGAPRQLAVELRGQPIAWRGGSELVLWQPARSVDGVVEPGHLSLWSIAALQAGQRQPVCTSAVAMDFLSHRRVPVFAADGRCFAIGEVVYGDAATAPVLWRMPKVTRSILLPASGGTVALGTTLLESPFSSGTGPWELHLRLLTAEGTELAKRTLAHGSAAWSSDGSCIAVFQHEQLLLLDPQDLSERSRHAVGAQLGAWVDADRLLVADRSGRLSLLRRAPFAVLATLTLPRAGSAVTVAPDGARAAITCRDAVSLVRLPR